MGGCASVDSSTGTTNTTDPPSGSSEGGAAPMGNGGGAAAAGAKGKAPVAVRRNRRVSVSAECGPVQEYVPTGPPKSAEEEASIRNAISKDSKCGFFFDALDADEMGKVLTAFEKHEVSAGTEIIKEGAEGDYVYIIVSGTFEAFVGGNLVFTYNGKGCFGELALMYNSPRAATVIAKESGSLWKLNRTAFRSIVVASHSKKMMMYEKFVSDLDLFKNLSGSQKAQMADCFMPVTAQDGEVIVKQGETVDDESKFYVVVSGQVDVHREANGETKLVKSCKVGEFFGEMALVEKAPRAATCIAVGTSELLYMTAEAFERVMGPVGEVLKESVDEYKRVNAELAL